MVFFLVYLLQSIVAYFLFLTCLHRKSICFCRCWPGFRKMRIFLCLALGDRYAFNWILLSNCIVIPNDWITNRTRYMAEVCPVFWGFFSFFLSFFCYFLEQQSLMRKQSGPTHFIPELEALIAPDSASFMQAFINGLRQWSVLCLRLLVHTDQELVHYTTAGGLIISVR